MRLAVLSDIHVLGDRELEQSEASAAALGSGLTLPLRLWRRGLYRARNRLWNWHPEPRRDCFLRALDDVEAFEPDWVVANGDYGGDTQGVGLSDESTFQSAEVVVSMVRALFPNRCRFVFGDHDIGKYSTNLRQGGIRIESLDRGEQLLGIQSFWHEEVEGYHLIGINSSLFGLHLFLPEAIEEEIPEWQRRQQQHMEEVREAFETLPASARVLLFCHDPGALATLDTIPAVRARQRQIERTILGHLHSPGLLRLARMVPPFPKVKPRYPVARIIARSLSDKSSWRRFNPILCPSTFGTGQHVSGGALFAETNGEGRLVIRRHRIASRKLA
jgi:3',5'-cyclic AMP phosphodiesterase CpdA